MAGRGLLALALERQVSAAERLLTTLATSDVFEEISAQQADAVVQAMATGKLTVLELADLSANVDKVPFAPGDKQKIADAMALAARDASKPTKTPKRRTTASSTGRVPGPTCQRKSGRVSENKKWGHSSSSCRRWV